MADRLKVADRLCVTINNLSKETIQRITLRSWISDAFT